MKILYLAPPARVPGTKLGRYSFLHEEILGLAERGVEVHVLAARPAPPASPGVRVHPWGGRPSPGELAGMLSLFAEQRHRIPRANWAEPKKLMQALQVEHLAARVVRTQGLDLIHSHFGWSKGFGGLLAARRARVPLLASFHGADILIDRGIAYGRGRDPFFARTIRVLLHQADRTLYYSDYMRQVGVQLGAPNSATTVVHWGTDVEAFAGSSDPREVRQALGLPPRPTLLAVAGLIERKGIDFVLTSLALLKETHDVGLVVCGDGPEFGHLTQLTYELNLHDRVQFAGRVERARMPTYFAAADVFVHGALTEAAGIVLIEAMASGCPVVCTDAGGPAEYVEDGVTGFVVPVRDSTAMAAKIAWLLDRPAERQRFGAAGRQRAVERFGRERMLQQMIAEYGRLAGKRGHQPR